MPKHIPCPACETGSIIVRNTGGLYSEKNTGLLVRECLVECRSCLRKGKMLVTIDIALYLDGKALGLEPSPFPTDTAA